MAFLFGLRTLLECLGKADKGREERDHSGQELHELGEIGHGHHLPSNGGLCPARGLPTARTILSERLTPARYYHPTAPVQKEGRQTATPQRKCTLFRCDVYIKLSNLIVATPCFHGSNPSSLNLRKIFTVRTGGASINPSWR